MARYHALPPLYASPPPRALPAPKVAGQFYRSREWRELVGRIKRERGARCQRCGSTHRVIGDHVIEIRDGGAPLDPSNIELLCQAHHNGKTAEAARRRAHGGAPVPAEAPMPMAHPDWFRASLVPLVIVCGPPASGKSTFVRRRAALGGDRVICFDTIAAGLFGAHRARLSGRQVGDVLRVRNDMLGDLMRASATRRWSRAWLIVAEPEARWRQWWSDRVRPECILVLPVPADECRRRALADAEAGDARTETALASIDTWWAAYTPRPGDILG